MDYCGEVSFVKHFITWHYRTSQWNFHRKYLFICGWRNHLGIKCGPMESNEMCPTYLRHNLKMVCKVVPEDIIREIWMCILYTKKCFDWLDPATEPPGTNIEGQRKPKKVLGVVLDLKLIVSYFINRGKVCIETKHVQSSSQHKLGCGHIYFKSFLSYLCQGSRERQHTAVRFGEQPQD